MSQEVSEPGEHALAPKQQTLLKSSVVMASGTLVSRVLGFVRSALLIAVLGVTAGAAESFSIANTLPNMVYNLLAAGIIDAVLIPQIVRALKGRAGSAYVNKLLTAAGTLLFFLTLLSMVTIPVIITIMAPTLTPGMRSLTITFAIICVPQIFFYGLYNLLGELLNARGLFGPYMWAPVINNVVGIASLALFLKLWGPAGDIRAAESMTATQIAVVAGLSTVGVMAQALWLFIPMRKSGLKLRLDFHLKGTDFGSASKVAWWTFATLLVSQIGVISTSNLATRAGAWAQETGEIVAGIQAYQYAFMLYMVPQSLISVTLATAIFTRLANDVADGNMEGVAENFHRGVELIMLFSFFVAAVLAVTATSVMQMIMPTFGAVAATIYGNVLIALIFALPSTGMVLMSQRVFFAFEDAKPVFLMGIVPTILQVLVGWGIYFVTSAQWWTIGASLGETVCRVVQGFIGIVWVGRLVRQVNVGRLVSRYLRFLFAFAVSSVVGWLLMRLLGGLTSAQTSMGRFMDSAWKVTVVSIVIAGVYFALLSLIDPGATKEMAYALTARFRPRRTPAQPLDPGTEVDSELEVDEALAEANSSSAASSRVDAASGEDGTLGTPDRHHSVRPEIWGQTPPEWEDVLAGAGAERALSRSLSVPDMSSTGAIPILSGAMPLLTERVPTQSGAIPVVAAPTRHTRGNVMEMDSGRDDQMTTAQPGEPAGNSAQGGPGGRQAKKDKKFNPTAPAMILGLVLVIVAGTLAVKNLFPPSASELLAELETNLPQSSQSADGQSSGEDQTEAEEAEPVTEAAAPVVTGATVFSWDNDDGDHPELASALLDGDANTVWRSRYFNQNVFSEGNEIAILLTLAEPAVVSEITINVVGEGGEVEVTDASAGDPRLGTVLATAQITPETVIRLAQPTEVSALGLVFNTLPVDDEGMNRAKITGISVR